MLKVKIPAVACVSRSIHSHPVQLNYSPVWYRK